MLLSPASRLMRVSFVPRPGPGSVAFPKWDGPSLPLLNSLPLTSLHVSRLSQRGARTLSVLLSNMGEYSTLEDLSVDFVWLDDQLCEMIAKAGSKIRKLRIGTSGTKLTDKGVAAIIEGCDALEDLIFDEVQGLIGLAPDYSVVVSIVNRSVEPISVDQTRCFPSGFQDIPDNHQRSRSPSFVDERPFALVSCHTY